MHNGIRQAELPANRTGRTAWLVAAVGLMLIGMAGVIRMSHDRRVAESEAPPLQGDTDEAPAALNALLDKTEVSGRLPLLLKLVRDPSPSLRYAAVDTLGSYRSPAVADALERAFQDSSSVVRQRAMEVLPNVDQDRGLRTLLAGLKDDDYWIRDAASAQLFTLVKAHHSIVDRRTIPALVAATDDPDRAVRITVMATLRRLTGKPWQPKALSSASAQEKAARQWHTWWTAQQAHERIPPQYVNVPPVEPTRADPAPDFTLPDVDGRTASLASQRGRVTLLNFWGTWCPPCKQEVPDLVRLYNADHDRGFDILGIALSEDSADSLRNWCAKHGVPYRQAMAQEPVQAAYGNIHEVPVSVLIDRQGRVRYRWEGERDFATFRSAVERLLAESATG